MKVEDIGEITFKDCHTTDIIPYLAWFNDVPVRKQVDSESTESIISNVLLGNYYGLLGLVNGEPVSLLVYRRINKFTIGFKFVHAQGYMALFFKELMNYLYDYDITKFEFESIHQSRLWSRVFPGRIKLLRQTYEFDISGMFKGLKPRLVGGEHASSC